MLQFNDFLKKFSRSDLSTIRNYCCASIILSIFGLILNFYIYFSVSFLGFIYWGIEGFYFIYADWLNIIEVCYTISWICIYIAVSCVFLSAYLTKFTINPFLDILMARKNQDKEKLKKEIKEFKGPIFLRLLMQFFLIIVMVIFLNYYPRNVELFYPYIGCNAISGRCVITQTAFYQFIMVMTSFLFIIIGLYLIGIIINLMEIRSIQGILNPVKSQINTKKKEERQKKYEERIKISIEKRRALRINQLREGHKEKLASKRKKLEKKFDSMLQKEKFGKKAHKQLQLKREHDNKQQEQIKKKKDKFDFT